MWTKKDLLKRIKDLQYEVNCLTMNSISRDWVENFVRNQPTVSRSQFEFLRDTVQQQGEVLKIYREILLTSGLITPCDASRTEFQWQESQNDKFGGAFHFKVNQIVTKKEKQ
jgi:hypothetical protein